jgi:hypothetical protein
MMRISPVPSYRVSDKLTTRNFNTGTRGFAAPEDVRTAVCVLPGTELAFAKEPEERRCSARTPSAQVARTETGLAGWGRRIRTGKCHFKNVL